MKSLSEKDIGVILGRESGLQEITATRAFPSGPIPAGSGEKGNQWFFVFEELTVLRLPSPQLLGLLTTPTH